MCSLETPDVLKLVLRFAGVASEAGEPARRPDAHLGHTDVEPPAPCVPFVVGDVCARLLEADLEVRDERRFHHLPSAKSALKHVVISHMILLLACPSPNILVFM